MDSGTQLYNVYGWIYPNTEKIVHIGCGDYADAMTYLDGWMDKSLMHDGWVVSVDEDPNYEESN